MVVVAWRYRSRGSLFEQPLLTISTFEHENERLAPAFGLVRQRELNRVAHGRLAGDTPREREATVELPFVDDAF